jgi:hypothetical protein
MLTRTEYRYDFPTSIDCNFDCFKTTLNQPTGDFFYDPWEIKSEFKDTVWKDILDSLPLPKGEARVINLGPGETYMAHADIDDRWHYNIQSQEGYLIDLNDKKMFLLNPDGYWYSMDAGRLHVAANFGSINRIQLVVRKLLTRSIKKDLVLVSISSNGYQSDFRYKFDNTISPWLNEINKKGSMKDFSFKENSVTFRVERSELDTLSLTNDFLITIS